jgi:hypothetical protein
VKFVAGDARPAQADDGVKLVGYAVRSIIQTTKPRCARRTLRELKLTKGLNYDQFNKVVKKIIPPSHLTLFADEGETE